MAPRRGSTFECGPLAAVMGATGWLGWQMELEATSPAFPMAFSQASTALFRWKEDISIIVSHIWESGSADCLSQTELFFLNEAAVRGLLGLGVFRLSGKEILG